MSKNKKTDVVNQITTLLLSVAIALLLIIPIPYYLSLPLSFLKVLAQSRKQTYEIPVTNKKNESLKHREPNETLKSIVNTRLTHDWSVPIASESSLLPFYFK